MTASRAAACAALLCVAAFVSSCSPPARVAGDTVQLEYADMFESWQAAVRVPGGWTWPAGGQTDLTIRARATLPLITARPEAWQGVYVVVWGERIYDAAGRYSQEDGLVLSSFLTPSGIPVEAFQWDPPVGALGAHYRSPIEGVTFVPRSDVGIAGDRLSFTATVGVKIDADCPEAYYRPHVRLMIKTTDGGILDVSRLPMAFSPYMVGSNPDPRAAVLGYTRLRNMMHPSVFLPAVRVGRPEEPHLVVALFTGTTAGGIRGILAREDDGHVALSRRSVYGGRLILRPGTYPLDPSPIAYFPQRAVVANSGGSTHIPDALPDFLDFASGELAIMLTRPDGTTIDLGRNRLRGVKDGVLQWDRPADLQLDATGRYQVAIDGWTSDLIGTRYRIAGTYELWCAQQLTFSTAAKIGTSFFVGGQFPPKVQIHPMVPAYVKLHERFYPRSDPARMKEIVQQGWANPFGYFVPGPDQPRLQFDEPGEYAVDIVVAHRDEHGQLWMGAQTAAGVVAEEHPDVALHGYKVNFEGPTDERPEHGLADRFRLHDENSLGSVDFDFTDCHDTPPPYHSGDVMYLATTLDGSNNISPLMSQATARPAVLDPLLEMFAHEPHFATHNMPGITAPPRFRDGLLRLVPFSDAYFMLDEPARTGQLPILSRHRAGLSPYDYPEGTSVRNYYYFSAIRPGFPAFTAVSDSTAYHTYWSPSPNSFAGLPNAGPTGDLPQDLYRIDGGLVYRDEDTGVSSYSAYASAVVIQPRESYDNRTLAPVEEPLVRVNGEDYPLFLAVEAAAILTPGDPLALAAVVFPPVPAHVRMAITDPSGTQRTVEGDANSIGMFSPRDGVVRLTEPGAYAVDASVSYQGKTGGAYGSVGIPYYHFVAPPDRPRLMTLRVPETGRFDPTGTLDIPIEIASDVHDPVLTWVVMCPGIIMDRGREKVDTHAFTYRFMPTHFAAQFPNYQVVDYQTGEPVLAKSTFLTFFVEGTDAAGRRVQDVRYVMLRQNALYAPATMPTANDDSRRVLEDVFADPVRAAKSGS